MLRLTPALIALALFAAACGGSSGSAPEVTEPPKTPEETVERFLTLWQERKYTEMYDLVSSEAKLDITSEKFVERYTAITDETTITEIKFRSQAQRNARNAGGLVLDHLQHSVLRRNQARERDDAGRGEHTAADHRRR